MAMTADERKRYVQKVVRESVKAADGRDVKVTQDTSLGTAGLGHGCELRKTYLPFIKRRMQEVGCKVNLAPQALCAGTVVRVRDVTTLVINALDCS